MHKRLNSHLLLILFLPSSILASDYGKLNTLFAFFRQAFSYQSGASSAPGEQRERAALTYGPQQYQHHIPLNRFSSPQFEFPHFIPEPNYESILERYREAYPQFVSGQQPHASELPPSPQSNNSNHSNQSGQSSGGDGEPEIHIDFTQQRAPGLSNEELEDQLRSQFLNSMILKNESMLIKNNGANGTIWQYATRPEIIVSAFIACIPLIPRIVNFINKHLDEPDPQVERINEINMEAAELQLAQKKLHFKRENQQAQTEEIMQMLTLKKAALGTQEKQTELEKEDTKLQLINTLSSLTKKKAEGQELNEQETEQRKLCQQMLLMLTQSKPDEPDIQEESPEADIQQQAIATTAA